MLVITADSSRVDLEEALANLKHEASRVTIADPKHATLHASIDVLLTAWQETPA